MKEIKYLSSSIRRLRTKKQKTLASIHTSVSDPHKKNTDPDPGLHKNADPDPGIAKFDQNL